jgi:hypothetical protein
VKYYVSPLVFADGEMMHRHAFKEISNPYSDFGDMRNWSIFHKIEMLAEWNGIPPWWQRILFYPDGKVR